VRNLRALQQAWRMQSFIFRGINVPDGHSLLMRNLVESMPRRLADVLSGEGNPSRY
jgi:hypothetical protein